MGCNAEWNVESIMECNTECIPVVTVQLLIQECYYSFNFTLYSVHPKQNLFKLLCNRTCETKQPHRSLVCIYYSYSTLSTASIERDGWLAWTSHPTVVVFCLLDSVEVTV